MNRGRRASVVTAGRTAAAALVLLPALAYAQRAGVVEQLPPGAPPAVQACVGCHGAQGQGNPESGTPRIAGQSQRYLLKQLESYADGTRRSRIMEPIARGLPPEIRADVARYFAQSVARVAESDEGGAPPERGRVLAQEGDNALGVQACRNCHGPGGVGEPPNVPYVAGLDADYIVHELRAFQQGTRTNDAGQQMFTVVTGLPEADIEAVAQYYASLPPPEPAPPNLVRSPPPPRPQAQVQRVVPAGPGGAGEAGRARAGDAQGLGGAETSAAEAPDADESKTQAAERAPTSSGSKAERAGRPGRVGAGQGGATTGGTQGAGGTGGSAVEQKDAPQDGAQRRNRAGQGEGQEQTQEPQWPAIIDEPKPAEPQSFAPTAPADPERGRAIVASGEYGCPACHAIPGIEWPRGIVGPPLENFGHRALIAGQLPNDAQTLAAFVLNAPAMVPNTGMPNLGLSFEQARHVAAYLRTLGTGDSD